MSPSPGEKSYSRATRRTTRRCSPSSAIRSAWPTCGVSRLCSRMNRSTLRAPPRERDLPSSPNTCCKAADELPGLNSSPFHFPKAACMAGPLSDIRVLDLSRVLAGPWAGQNLADLGAEVIKVERPGSGDDSRAFGPPWVKDKDGRDTRDSAYYTSANRGKKSITLNIARPDGQKLARELAAISDVLIENYKFGDLARYGLSYEDLKKTNPRLIYCSVTGFGQTGPYRERPGYDFMIQGMGGMMSVTGEPDGTPGGGPQRAGVPIADIITGMYASIAICAALAHRERSGRGQHLDLALLDSQIALLAYQNTNYFATGVPPQRIGNLHPNIVPYQPFRSSDGQVILACGNDNLYRKFCQAAGCPELADDARFATNGKRVEYRLAPPLLGEHTDEVLRSVLGKSDLEIARLRAAGVI